MEGQGEGVCVWRGRGRVCVCMEGQGEGVCVYGGTGGGCVCVWRGRGREKVQLDVPNLNPLIL